MRMSEADELMRRFGHEGFPVVAADAQGRETLAGVLTHHEVNKTLGHGMGDQPVRRFMRTRPVRGTAGKFRSPCCATT